MFHPPAISQNTIVPNALKRASSGLAAVVFLAGTLMAWSAEYIDITYPELATGENIKLLGKLYIPPDHDDPENTEQFPLVIHFHGDGEYHNPATSSPPIGRQTGNISRLLEKAETNRFFLFAPQMLASKTPTTWSYHDIENAWRVVSRLTRTYRIDPRRIIVSGLSLGGGATWRSMWRYSDMVAAGVPICGTYNAKQSWAPLSDVPIWAFHAFDDGPKVPRTMTEDNINAVLLAADKPAFPFTIDPKALNAQQIENMIYTRFASGGHGIWGTVYTDAPGTLFPWILSRINEKDTNLSPGESIFFDLGHIPQHDHGGAWPDANGDIWNSLSVSGPEKFTDCVLPFAQTTTGKVTAVSLDITGRFRITFSLGTEPAKDGWETYRVASPTKDTAKLLIRGLVPGDSYDVEAYGFHTNSDGTFGRETSYQIGDTVRHLNAYQNLSETALFENVTADPDGRIEMLVYVKPGSTTRFGVINTLKITRRVTFAGWREEAFPDPADRENPAVSGPKATPRGDGVSNLLRYALGVPIEENAAASLPQLEPAGDGWAFRFPLDPEKSDLVYRVLQSNDLINWSTVVFDSSTDPLPPQEDGKAVLTLPTSPSRSFWRLEVQQAE